MMHLAELVRGGPVGWQADGLGGQGQACHGEQVLTVGPGDRHHARQVTDRPRGGTTKPRPFLKARAAGRL